MPSLYKSVAVEPAIKVSVPVAEIKTAAVEPPLQDKELIEKAVEVMAEALFQEKWKASLAELAIEKGRMLAEVEAERQKILVSAQKEGYKTGIDRAKVEADKLMQQVQRAYKTLEDDRLRFIEQCRENIIDLVIAATEEFIHEQLQQAPELLLNMVGRAIQELVSQRKICVFVHPNRVETVAAHSYLLPATADGGEVIVRSDPTLDIDSFRVEDETGSVVVSLPEHIRKMKQVVS